MNYGNLIYNKTKFELVDFLKCWNKSECFECILAFWVYFVL